MTTIATASNSISSEAMRFIEAARVPDSVPSGSWGLWTIARQSVSDRQMPEAGWRMITTLGRMTMATMHLPYGDVVMEDSMLELSRHLPIWMRASGDVLVSGLGLGCVVRGLLASDRVTGIDVVEVDKTVLDVVGREFAGNPRVSMRLGDARSVPWPGGKSWDFAWHDVWHEDGNGGPLAKMHVELLWRFRGMVRRGQGAWNFPRELKRILPGIIG